MYTYNPRAREVETRRDPGALWRASLAYLMSFRPVGGSVSKNKAEGT